MQLKFNKGKKSKILIYLFNNYSIRPKKKKFDWRNPTDPIFTPRP